MFLTVAEFVIDWTQLCFSPQFNDLMRKKRIVENDKTKIETVIRELDEKKNEALRQAWEQVNKDFGSIFGTLLPGTNAKLQPPEGGNVLDGLEVGPVVTGLVGMLLRDEEETIMSMRISQGNDNTGGGWLR